MSAAARTPDKTPEWMLLLEKKKNRPHRLAHEIGAGAPCLACGDGCPGLDLHFWRKVCRNCKCKKEEHDVKDDDGYEQFEILLGAGGKRKKPGAVLKIKVPEAVNSAVVVDKKGVPFDWVPPNVSDDVAAEYMQQLPAAKLPISGSDGALYRRQQLERQMPLHDLDAARCHNLTPQEIEELQKYLDNLKSNVVGQGRVTKVPILYTEQRHTYRGPTLEQVSSRPNALLPTSHSYQSLPLPPLPSTFNTVPRPFQTHSNVDVDSDVPPPLPSSNPPDFQGPNLKTPSSFVAISGTLQSSQYPHGIANSTDVSMNPGSTRPFGSTIASHGSLAARHYPHNVAHSSDVSRQMNPGSTKPYDSTIASHEGSLAAQHYPHNVAHSSDVSRQMNPGSTKPYDSTIASHEGSLSSQHYPHNVVHSSDVSRQINPGTTKPYGSTIASHEGSLAAQHYPHNVAHSSDVSRQMNPGSTKPYGSTMGYQDEQSLLMQQYPQAGHQSVPNSANMTNRAHGFANVQNMHNSGGSFPQDGSILTTRNVSGRPIANSASYSNLKPGISSNQNVNTYSSGENEFPLDAALQRTQNRDNVAKSSTSGNSPPQYSNLQNAGLHGNPMGAFPGDGSNHAAQNQYGSDNLSPSSSQTPNNHGNTSSTQPGDRLNTQYQNTIVNPTVYQQYTGGPPQNELSHADTLNTGKYPNMDVAESGYSQIPGEMRLDRLPFRPAVASSADINGDSMPRSARVIQQSNVIDNELAAQMELLSAEEQNVESHLNCKHCGEALIAGDVAVFADRAGANTAWHPKCFVCNSCDELLVDLIYFFSKGNVYCGRHFAELLNIPRCFACDELIFVKEYTVAEGKTFHVKHFCCYECDDPLAGKQYIPTDDQPTCIDCYQDIFGKRCNTCRKQIPAGQQRVGWMELNWHAQAECFRCFTCSKSLLGGKFVMKEQQPFCDKDCVAQLGAGNQ